MKRFLKIFFLVVAVLTVAFILYVAIEVATPVSSMIAKERDQLARSLKEHRAGKDADEADRIAAKIEALNFQLAVAYNAEDRPEKAITVLENLIKIEQSKAAAERGRNSRSYRSEARYYETMIDSCVMKKDEDCAERARHRRLDALSRAEDRKRQEMLKEGKSVGWEGE